MNKEMLCSHCYRVFVPDSKSWNSAEKELCPYCKSRDTTPILELHVGGKQLKQFALTFRERI